MHDDGEFIPLFLPCEESVPTISADSESVEAAKSVPLRPLPKVVASLSVSKVLPGTSVKDRAVKHTAWNSLDLRKAPVRGGQSKISELPQCVVSEATDAVASSANSGLCALAETRTGCSVSVPTAALELRPSVQPQVSPVSGRPLSSAVFIELCAGSGGLTAAIRKLGLDGIAIDLKKVDRPKAPIIDVDLTTEHGRAMVLRIIQTIETVHIHAGPPCGTSS